MNIRQLLGSKKLSNFFSNNLSDGIESTDKDTGEVTYKKPNGDGEESEADT